MAEQDSKKQKGGPYGRFMAMFFLVHVNTYSVDHIFWSESRFCSLLDEEGNAGSQGMQMIVVPPGADDELGYRGHVQC